MKVIDALLRREDVEDCPRDRVPGEGGGSGESGLDEGIVMATRGFAERKSLKEVCSQLAS